MTTVLRTKGATFQLPHKLCRATPKHKLGKIPLRPLVIHSFAVEKFPTLVEDSDICMHRLLYWLSEQRTAIYRSSVLVDGYPYNGNPKFMAQEAKILSLQFRILYEIKYIDRLKVGAFSALQPVGRLHPCPIEFPSFISRGATHHIGTRDLC